MSEQERRYGQWAGNEHGVAEDKTRCIKEVFGGSWISWQCKKKRGYGPNGEYCKQHAKGREDREQA